jgi:hypothetical protein
MIKIREIEEKDIIPLAEMLPQFEPPFSGTPKETWLRRFKNWWTLNPAYTPQIPRGWILENDTKIVGFIGNIPVKFQIRGEERIAVAAVDWIVDPSYRIYSFDLFIEYLNQKKVSLFLFNTEEKHIIKILKRFKFEEYILPLNQTEYMYIINRKKIDLIFKEFIFNRKAPKLTDFSDILRRLRILLFVYISQKPIIRYEGSPKKDYLTSCCTACDYTFSQIWEPYLATCDITLSREIKTLNWLYFSSIEPSKRVVIQCHRLHDKMLVGYMVFDLERNKTLKTGNMTLKDMCIKDNNPEVLASLLSFAIEIGEQNSVASIVVWADNPAIDTYFRKRFTLSRVTQYRRYLRFSEGSAVDSDHLKICLSLIAPPHGIDHL